ncbi:AbiJ-related protein [Acinetobacter piscicola]|uniref:AbiJ-related protein n=1 Tax=Acinetobacter piscicola TaxID=2006115 RepID=UPI000B7F3DA0|nr:AAA family ATPase [Acinetobacter piscicola]
MDNLTLSRNLKIEILKLLSIEEVKLFQNIDSVDFFEEILDLRSLPSNDSRYQNARGDFIQHFINNSDWTLEEVFLDRFNFINSDINFINLLNFVISSQVNSNEYEIKFFFYTLNSLLAKEKFEYIPKGYDENNLPIYKVGRLDSNKRFKDIPDNTIPFLMEDNNINQRFILKKSKWNDFGCENSFILYFKEASTTIKVGELKIISKEKFSSTSLINDTFYQLPADFCSLGQSFEYYKTLKNLFSTSFLSILKALNDSAFFVQIVEEFETTPYFTLSLIRFPQQEQLIRQAKYRLDNYDLSNLYSFNYIFKPTYLSDDTNLNINFKFNAKEPLANRIYALIGKNGVGKTQLISKLPLDIANNNQELFSPKKPLFSKIIAVSYSVFDKFPIPNNSSTFNYLYCGLRIKKDNNEYLLNSDELLNRFFSSISKIGKNNYFESWVEIIENFLSKESVDSWFFRNKTGKNLKFKKDAFLQDHSKFSSGQAIFVYIFTEILANIRYDSLILFDEPETHLHPNAISQLINSIHLLLDRFQSYCIIATHSPIIVQGILSQNVYVIRNESNILSIRHPSLETFGENLTRITDDIFGSRDTQSYFKSKLEQLVKAGYNYDQINSLLTSENTSLSLNASILLNNLVNHNDQH